MKDMRREIRRYRIGWCTGYILELTEDESAALRSKILTIEDAGAKTGRYSKYRYKAFTEKGLYMLATILKSDQAERDKVRLNKYYYEHYSFWRGIEMIFATVLGRKMTYAGEEI